MSMLHGDFVKDPKTTTISGASGLVDLGSHKTTGLGVAIKYLTKYKKSDILRFSQENEILHELLNNKNVITPYSRVLSHPQDASRQFYMMERADESLHEWLERFVFDDDLSEKTKLLVKIAEAIISIQAGGYVHRDLHEKNVLVSRDGDNYVPKLVDFGRGYKRYGTIGLSDGTRPSWGYYMRPPEVAFGLIGHGDNSHTRGDAYAFGLLIKTALAFDGISNVGRLHEMRESIEHFQKIKNKNDPSGYLKSRSFEQRKEDYDEWCSINLEDTEKWKLVKLDTDKRSELVSSLIQGLTHVDYRQRVNDLTLAINTLKEL